MSFFRPSFCSCHFFPSRCFLWLYQLRVPWRNPTSVLTGMLQSRNFQRVSFAHACTMEYFRCPPWARQLRCPQQTTKNKHKQKETLFFGRRQELPFCPWFSWRRQWLLCKRHSYYMVLQLSVVAESTENSNCAGQGPTAPFFGIALTVTTDEFMGGMVNFNG